MKKLIALLMTITMLFSLTVATVGCKKKAGLGDGDDVILYFQLDNLGFGTHWLEESCQRFMEQQKDVEYPGGKKGVYCKIIKGNTPTAQNIEQSGSHVVFRGGQGQELAETGNIWDINDIVRNEEIPGEPGVTIESKLYPESKGYFQANDGHYYTLPAHEIYAGLSYDKKVFDRYGFYFARQLDGDQVLTGDRDFSVYDYEDEFPTEMHMSSLVDGGVYYFLQPKPTMDDGYANEQELQDAIKAWEKGKSCGPNGVYGDYDDGLASSLYELFVMWEYMAAKKISPMLVSGSQLSLSNAFLDAFPSALMGYEKAKGQLDLDGNVDAVIGFSYSGIERGLNEIEAPIVQNVEIDEESGYYSTWAVEKYFTMAAMELLYNKNYLNKSSIPGDPKQVDHLGAQKKFLDSGHKTTTGTGDEIGMLMEYSYWWNEASIRGRVTSFEKMNPDVGDREIRWMPLPVNIKTSVTGEDVSITGNPATVSYRFASAEQGNLTGTCREEGTEYKESVLGEKNLLVQTGWSGFIIGKKAATTSQAESEALKDWLLFFHSDKELSAITASQGFRKGLMYEMEETDTTNWAPFYKDLYELSEISDIVRPASETETFKTAITTFVSRGEGNFAWQCAHGHMYSCYRTTPDKSKNRSSRRCFIYIMITKDEWSKHYKGGKGDNTLIHGINYPGTDREIIFIDGDADAPA